VPHLTILGVVLAFALVQVDPPKVLFSVFFVYALSGPVNWFREKINKSESQDGSTVIDDQNSQS
jgi:CDP-diacylglycerol--serine O-phosphatidyltransferase